MKTAPAAKSRRGAAIVMALVAMAVLTVILAVVTIQVYAQHVAARQRQHQLQATWLARAGVELAAGRLLTKGAAFREEHLELVADAKVIIVVEKTDDGSFTVTADAEVGIETMPGVVRTATARFRRVESEGIVRLQAIEPE
jgi:hypothetical protein